MRMGGAAVTLSDALSLKKGITAIVGGGGKTTLLLRLARELCEKGSVLVCTTAHMLVPEGLPLLTNADEDDIKEALQTHRALCAGEREAQTGKLVAPRLSMEALEALFDYVLVEADGSKGLPLKAHAGHEPPIPQNAGRILYVVGVDGIGKTVAEAAHRPELYAARIGKTTEHIVTPEDAARAAMAVNNAIAVVNKAESEEALAHARAFCKAYEGRAAICSLKSERPLIEVWENGIRSS